MKLFNCKVRIMGEVKDEVVRTNVTNAEIRILRSIHGEDGVVDIQPTGQDATTSFEDFDDLAEDGQPKRKSRARTEAEERARLEMFYGDLAVAKIFGISRPSITDEPSSIEDIMGAVIPLEPVVRAEVKPAKSAPKALQLEDVN